MNRRLPILAFLLLPCLAGSCLPARADQQLLISPAHRPFDPGANSLVRLFMDACIPASGYPAPVFAWARAQNLERFTDEAALDAFVGPGGKGAAWQVPLPTGHFALAVRGTTQACAVFAEKADPSLVETDFDKILGNIRSLGTEVRKDQDTMEPTPLGQAHALVYHIAGAGEQGGLELTMLTSQKPGGAFQASLQMLALPHAPGTTK